MKKVLAFLFTFIVMMVVADIFQPSAIKAASAVPQMVIQVVSSTGTVLNGVASAVSAVPRETVQIVDSSGHIIDSFSSSGGSGTVSSVATLGLEVYYSVLNTTVGGITGYIHAYPYATHFEQAIEACPQNAWAGTHGYAQFNVIADSNGDTELNITAGTNNSGGSTPTWPASSGANVGTQTPDGAVTWEMIAVGTYAPSQACTIVVDPGTYTQTKMAIVGSGATAMDVEDHNGFISCSVTGGAGNACLVMADKGTLHGSHSNSSNSGSEIGQTGSSIDAVVESESGYLHNLQTNPISYQQINWDVSGIWIAPNPNNTILQAAVWESGIDGQGYSQNDYVSAGPTGSTGWLVDHAGTVFWNNLVFNNIWIGMGSEAIGFEATAGTSGSGGQMVWTGGAVVDGNANATAHVDLEGNSGGAFYSATFNGGPYIETDSGESTDSGFLLNGIENVTVQGIPFDGSATMANCIDITGTSPGQVEASGYALVDICTTIINNTVSGYTTTTPGNFKYLYNGSPTAGLITDVGGATVATAASANMALTPGNACNIATDNGVSWASLTPGGDLACAVTTGQFTVKGFKGFPLTTAPTANTPGFVYLTNSSNQFVPTRLPVDACSTVGCINVVGTTGSPNTYSALNGGALGTVLTGQGTTSIPTYSTLEAPTWVNFQIDGTISTTNRFKVCPATLKYSPGLQTVYPTVASQGRANTAPSSIDTYTFSAGSTLGSLTPFAFGYLQPTTGVMNFGTPACSMQIDGTQGGTAYTSSAGAQTLSPVVPSTAAAGDVGLLACTTNSAAGSWGSGPSGWSPVTGGSFTGTSISTILYEKNPLVSGDLGAGVACPTYSVSAAFSAGVWTFKGQPSGEVVDAIAATRAAATSLSAPSVTPNQAGDFDFVLFTSPSADTVSAPSAPLTLGNTSHGEAYADMWLGGTTATAAYTATLSASNVSYSINIAMKSGFSTCTLCTAGNEMEMAIPGTTESEADINAAIGGVP